MTTDIDSRQWAVRTLDDMAASVDRKRKLQALRAADSDALIAECLLIALTKRRRYVDACRGQVFDSTGWLTRDYALARATHAITSAGLPVNDVPMMPDNVPMTPVDVPTQGTLL